MGPAARRVGWRDRRRARWPAPRRPLHPRLTGPHPTTVAGPDPAEVVSPAVTGGRASLLRLARRLRRRWVLLLLVAVALAGVGAVASQVVAIKHDLDAGRSIIAGLDLRTIDAQGGLRVVVDRAADHLDAADTRARTSPVLRLLSTLPVVGDQVDGLRSMTGTVAAIGDAGRDAADRIQTALDEGSGPAARIEVTRVASEELATLREVVAGVHLDDTWLVPPLTQARDQLRDQLEKANVDLARGSELTAALEAFLTGPRRYLILGGNNAEMRSGGIPTTSGIARIEGGAIQVGRFSGATDAIELPYPGVPVSADYQELYGFLYGAQSYRTATATANWPVAAQIISDITDRNAYGHVDGVIFVDTITLAALLSIVGPVDVDGITFTAQNAIRELLYENYVRYPTFSPADQSRRKDLQSDVAQAIFAALNERDFSITRLAGFLSRLARDRNLLAWSSDPAENELWQTLGADGALLPNTIGVVANQLNASKLDYFARLDVEFDSHVEGDRHHVALRIRVTNPEHPETGPYIDGGGRYADPGEVAPYLVVYLPAGAADISNDDPGLVHAAPDGDTFAVGMILRVPEGESRDVEVDFTLPLRPDDTLHVLPSARLNTTSWTVGGRRAYDLQLLDLHLDTDGAELRPQYGGTVPAGAPLPAGPGAVTTATP